MGGAILGLVAFMLAFTFGIASSRFDVRKELVRDEARAIETTYLAWSAWATQGGITGSKRSLASVILALSFALVTSLIFALDRPATRGFRVPQQPLADVRARVAATHGDLPPKRPTDAGGP